MITKGTKKIIILLVVIVTGIFGAWLLMQGFGKKNQQPAQSAQGQEGQSTKRIPDLRTLVS